jgi:hypothetical protein
MDKRFDSIFEGFLAFWEFWADFWMEYRELGFTVKRLCGVYIGY